VVRETYSPGGAANVAWNVADLDVAQVVAFTVFGEDWRGDLFKKVLTDARVTISACLTHQGWSTPLFGKIELMNGNLIQEDARLDFINQAALPETIQTALLEQVWTKLPELDGLIVADYQSYGIFNDWVRSELNSMAKTYPGKVFIADSRDHIGKYLAMIVKPNEIEACKYLFKDRDWKSVTEDELKEGGTRIAAATKKPVFMTRGENGCWLFEHETFQHIPAVKIQPPIDPVGAGDTFIAALAASRAVGASAAESAATANLAAAVTVKILHMTGTASPEAILDEYERTQNDN
jgi:rfaE bifunctional protein kinase chain/domain